jgi:hypothetical protein
MTYFIFEPPSAQPTGSTDPKFLNENKKKKTKHQKLQNLKNVVAPYLKSKSTKDDRSDL